MTLLAVLMDLMSTANHTLEADLPVEGLECCDDVGFADSVLYECTPVTHQRMRRNKLAAFRAKRSAMAAA